MGSSIGVVRRGIAGLVGVLSACLAGCFAPETNRPISTSLEDLLAEGRHLKGPVLEHHEVFSIAGLLPVPNVGAFYHYPPHQRFPYWGRPIPPGALIGLSRHTTFRIVGETANVPTADQVKAAADSLNTLREEVRQAISLEVQAAVARAQFARHQDPSQRMRLRERISTLEAESREQSQAVASARRAADSAVSAEGLLIADWATERRSRTSVKAGPLGELSRKGERTHSGFIVLGGLRVSLLHIGDDVKDIFFQLQREERLAFRFAGFTTYLLQAKHVRYSTALDIEAEVEAYLQFRPEGLGIDDVIREIDKIKLRGFFATAGAFSNRGSIGDLTWTSERINPREARVGLAVNPVVERSLNSPLVASPDDAQSIPYPQGWKTVQAVFTSPDRLVDIWDAQVSRRLPIRIGTVSDRAGFGLSEAETLNTELISLDATMTGDRAYLGMDWAIDSLSRLSRAVDRINTIDRRGLCAARSAEDGPSFTAAAADVRDVRALLERRSNEVLQDISLNLSREFRGWTYTDNGTRPQFDVVTGLARAAVSLEAVADRHQTAK
jgi:hypothetical protein